MRPITFLRTAIAAMALNSCTTSTIEVESNRVAGIE